MRDVSRLCALSTRDAKFKFSSAHQYSANKTQRAPRVSYLGCRPPKFPRTPTKCSRYNFRVQARCSSRRGVGVWVLRERTRPDFVFRVNGKKFDRRLTTIQEHWPVVFLFYKVQTRVYSSYLYYNSLRSPETLTLLRHTRVAGHTTAV